MHRLASRHSVVCFKVASWALIVRWMLSLAGIAWLFRALIMEDIGQAAMSGGLILGALLVGLFQLLVAVRACCPLCLTQPIAPRRCAKHRSARRLMGSYRLRVAFTVVGSSCFRCPYCGELTSVEVRRRE